MNGEGSKYLFNFLYGTYIPTNTKVLFKFSGKKMKQYVVASAGDWESVRLPSDLNTLSYEIDRATTNVGGSVSATKATTMDFALPGETDPVKHDTQALLVTGLFKNGMNFDAALAQYLTLTVEGLQNPDRFGNFTVVIEFQKLRDQNDAGSGYLTTDQIYCAAFITDARARIEQIVPSTTAANTVVGADTDLTIKYVLSNEVTLSAKFGVLF